MAAARRKRRVAKASGPDHPRRRLLPRTSGLASWHAHARVARAPACESALGSAVTERHPRSNLVISRATGSSSALASEAHSASLARRHFDLKTRRSPRVRFSPVQLPHRRRRLASLQRGSTRRYRAPASAPEERARSANEGTLSLSSARGYRRHIAEGRCARESSRRKSVNRSLLFRTVA